ncbi:OLC1v1037867C1 [Oldenlandia corymbosa var. corymbosa]|uniref:OLC1v1037867C1 n=1 Tax=Oldenlandia corymbosa var. corymbosa TaxID=529605 RepID=A0AAV1D1M1_OLDCO|nr:OLC1v1037867C1 [Oldenlandia corymbosa var. corymbosa]
MASLRAFLAICYPMVLLLSVNFPISQSIGINYGLLGNNLPPASTAVNLFKQKGWTQIRLFDPNPNALTALKGSGIQIILGTRNEDITTLASSVESATAWFNTYVQPYLENNIISYITVGNEVIPGTSSDSIPAAMGNLHTVLRSRQIMETKVSTVVATTVLANSYPPSATVFSTAAQGTMTSVLKVLSEIGSPLMVNVYPYFAYASDPANIKLEFAQFTSTAPGFKDGELSYFNLFDAMVDGFHWAIEKSGYGSVNLVVAESGWPSAGNGAFTSVELARNYNNKLKEHIGSGAGTPKKPGGLSEGFVFALFNENQKPNEVERNFGLFYPDMTPVYDF